jgi:hypothetical protein
MFHIQLLGDCVESELVEYKSELDEYKSELYEYKSE